MISFLVTKSIPHKTIPISFDMQEGLQEKILHSYHIQNKKAGITVKKYMGMVNLYSLIWNQKKITKILSQLPNSTPKDQLQLVIDIPIRRG